MDLKKDQMDKKWMCSLKEDIWQACDYFDSKEEAVTQINDLLLKLLEVLERQK